MYKKQYCSSTRAELLLLAVSSPYWLPFLGKGINFSAVTARTEQPTSTMISVFSPLWFILTEWWQTSPADIFNPCQIKLKQFGLRDMIPLKRINTWPLHRGSEFYLYVLEDLSSQSPVNLHLTNSRTDLGVDTEYTIDLGFLKLRTCTNSSSKHSGIKMTFPDIQYSKGRTQRIHTFLSHFSPFDWGKCKCDINSEKDHCDLLKYISIVSLVQLNWTLLASLLTCETEFSSIKSCPSVTVKLHSKL